MTIPLPALDAALHAIGDAIEENRWAAVAVLNGVLEDARMGNPLPVLLDISDDADWWASLCTPIELEGYLVAISRHLAETPLHIKARKRLIAGLWKKMGAEDQASFLEWAGANGAE